MSVQNYNVFIEILSKNKNLSNKNYHHKNNANSLKINIKSIA